ncbi:MAG: murein biosynthesis integral membrane protein MurJ, partial [Alcanivorax sp.]|nr:murein biosynthesis integral membrane protein MurJ [Alcanivorax sp.]
WLNAGLLYIGLRRGGVYRPMKGWWQHGLRLALAGGAMAGAIYWLARQATVWLNGALWDRILWLGLIVVAGLAVYLLALLILGLRPRHLRR